MPTTSAPDFAQPLAGLAQQQQVTVSSSVSVTGGLTTGDIVYSAASSRSGAVLCDGTLYDGTSDTYKALYAAIGTTYGGTGASSFAVPDLTDRVPVGAGGNTTLGADEGVSSTNRHNTRHRQTLTGGTFSGTISDSSATVVGGTGPAAGGGVGNNVYEDSAPVSGTVAGVGGVSTDPLDGPAYLALNPFIVL